MNVEGEIPTITPSAADNEATALSEEFIIHNRELTNGIVFGGVILVLIIVGGTLSIISRKENPEEEPDIHKD
ncbi:MAG: hypothetical protein MUO76_05145 [Anaerolineaceae bacterium]|nr:hypothetical protein [Anaerolineaceae bacterium]